MPSRGDLTPLESLDCSMSNSNTQHTLRIPIHTLPVVWHNLHLQAAQQSDTSTVAVTTRRRTQNNAVLNC
eukprot:6492482-Amphidinium_carterae.3